MKHACKLQAEKRVFHLESVLIPRRDPPPEDGDILRIVNKFNEIRAKSADWK